MAKCAGNVSTLLKDDKEASFKIAQNNAVVYAQHRE